MKNFNWTCPYCNHDQVVTITQYNENKGIIRNSKSVLGSIGFIIESIVCANVNCKQIQTSFKILSAEINPIDLSFKLLDTIHSWLLLPDSSAKPQPDFIPKQIVEDYIEACRIRDLSPKASATLSRRCLQGIIRDFCGITGNSLYSEIDILRNIVNEGDGIKHVNADTVEAIDHVRKIGNYGAHMEKDINLIINIDSEEAHKLIQLIELLFDEWYVQREDRKQRLSEIKKISEKKKIEKGLPKL